MYRYTHTPPTGPPGPDTVPVTTPAATDDITASTTTAPPPRHRHRHRTSLGRRPTGHTGRPLRRIQTSRIEERHVIVPASDPIDPVLTSTIRTRGIRGLSGHIRLIGEHTHIAHRSRLRGHRTSHRPVRHRRQHHIHPGLLTINDHRLLQPPRSKPTSRIRDRHLIATSSHPRHHVDCHQPAYTKRTTPTAHPARCTGTHTHPPPDHHPQPTPHQPPNPPPEQQTGRS